MAVNPIVFRFLAASLLTTTGVGCVSTPRTSAVLRASTFQSFDGKELPYKKWTPRRRNTDIVVIAVHGLSGAASDFWLLGERLPKRRVAVYAPELRGQGNDPDEQSRGDIISADQWVDDLRAFSELVRLRHPGVPVVWYGESMGSLIVLRSVASAEGLTGLPDGIVLASPAVDLRDGFPAWKRWAIRGASKIVPGARVALVSLDADVDAMQITSDTNHGDQMEVTPHALDTVTLRLLSQVDSLMESSGEHAEVLDVPVLVLYTPNDPLTSQEQVETFFNRIASLEKRSERFDRSYHLILHDVERERAATVVGDWVNQLPWRKRK